MEQEVNNYEHFLVDWVDANPGDILRVDHTVSMGNKSISRMRHWEVLRPIRAIGICDEGLVIREDQLMLVGLEDVKLVFDDVPEYGDPTMWLRDQFRELFQSNI